MTDYVYSHRPQTLTRYNKRVQHCLQIASYALPIGVARADNLCIYVFAGYLKPLQANDDPHFGCAPML